MASITSAGVGSGLDVASLVSQLVAAERQAPAARLSTAQSKAQSQLSAFGTFRSALASLQDAAKALRDGGTDALKATASEAGYVSLATGSGAAAGSYSLEVVQLAKAHKLASGTYASSATVVGEGTLSISVGGDSFDVVLDSSNSTLAGIRDAINGASGNTGVRASLLNTSTGTRLTLTSTTTGADGALTVQHGVGETALDGLVYDPLGSSTLSELDPAQNAKIRLDTYDFESSNNVFDEAIEGLTITATKAEPGKELSLEVNRDSAAAKSAVESFVGRYNALNATIATLARYNATTKDTGPLLGDSTLRGLSQQVRAVLSSGIESGTYTQLSQLGVSFGTDGALKIDTSKLTAAIESDAAAVTKLLGADGLGGKIYELATPYLASDGRIQSRQDAAQGRLKELSKQQVALEQRLTRMQARYQAQFGSLDTLISQLKTTSSYLTQQLENLPGY
ncbi:MAG: flagellar filament capping protein FliD [Stagnimonas sp.]|nr:flagellar filament capping protein FliD [Stagnimonas sp.]